MNQQPKEKRIINKHYLDWLKTQRCAKCERSKSEYMDIVPAHQNLGLGKAGGKGHDIYAIALCVSCHTLSNGSEHSGHKTFWGHTNIEKIILDQWQQYGIEHPEKVFWYPMDFYRMIIGAATQKWIEHKR